MTDEPTPTPTARGITTSEGIASLVAVAAPLLAALAKLDGWQLIAALGIAGAVAVAYGGLRTLLKLRGLAVLLVLLLAVPARADELPPVRGPTITMPTPPPVVPVVPPGALLLAAPVCTPAPPPTAFTDTPAGKALAYVSAIGAALVSVSASAAGILASWPR